MAQVTMELRLLLTTDFELFDFDYQLDDVNFKAQIEQQIIDFYYDYEIGQETPDMFKRKFKARWNRIIPYYNKLYNTTLLTYNPLSNYKLEEVLDQLATTSSVTDSTVDNISDSTSDNTSDSTSDVTGNTHNFGDSDTKTSDYPQQPIAGGDYLNGASNTISDSTSDTTDNTVNHATSNTTNHATGNTTGNVTDSGTINTDYTKTIEGVTGITYPELIEKHRGAILRINDMIIEEMKKCFILVF